MAGGIRTRSAHDSYMRRYELVLHTLVDVVQERPDISEQNRSTQKRAERKPDLTESSHLNTSSRAA
jgi:hypothetical protein